MFIDKVCVLHRQSKWCYFANEVTHTFFTNNAGKQKARQAVYNLLDRPFPFALFQLFSSSFFHFVSRICRSFYKFSNTIVYQNIVP